jgi:phage terminase large subunit GpA-like protein
MTTAVAEHPKALRAEAAWFLRQARPPRLRTMRQFAEEEVVIPDGLYVGRLFRCDRQPYTGLWFDAVDSAAVNGWNRFVATGPRQSGKTVCAYVIPILYHLFEIGETVVCGLPDMRMAADKWREDILPVIRRSRFRDQIPARGGGSRGGKIETIQFRNGQTLKFMSGGGGDKSRAGFTSRVIVITETDGMDEPGAASREADKITQIEACTRSFGPLKQVYMECTVSVPLGRTWREYEAGTASRILLPCPHCGEFVLPERENLIGWQAARTVAEARANAAFACPACGKAWTERQRVEANRAGKLVHRADGTVDSTGTSVGSSPDRKGENNTRDDGTTAPLRSRLGDQGNPQSSPTAEAIGHPSPGTLGFRWSAVHNLFLSAADVAEDEWTAARDEDEENATKYMCQFVWAVPYTPPVLDVTPLDAETVKRRSTGLLPKGRLPEDTEYVTIGVDLGKWLAHYVVVAHRPDGSPHVADYDVLEIDSDRLGVEAATLAALRELRDLCDTGWAPVEGAVRQPDQVWIDSGYADSADAVYAFCAESNRHMARPRYRPTKGQGTTQGRRTSYHQPKSTGAVVVHVGVGYHCSRLKAKRVYLIEIDADRWKGWVHERLKTPTDAPGAMTIFAAPSNAHTKFAKHMTSERAVQVFVPGLGTTLRWDCRSRNNHWLDAIYGACAAGHFCGARLETGVVTAAQAARRSTEPARPAIRMPDGRPFLVTER